MAPLIAASMQSDANGTLVIVALGFAVGVIGHLMRSRALVVIGIAMIAVASAYFTFALRPGSSGSLF